MKNFIKVAFRAFGLILAVVGIIAVIKVERGKL